MQEHTFLFLEIYSKMFGGKTEYGRIILKMDDLRLIMNANLASKGFRDKESVIHNMLLIYTYQQFQLIWSIGAILGVVIQQNLEGCKPSYLSEKKNNLAFLITKEIQIQIEWLRKNPKIIIRGVGENTCMRKSHAFCHLEPNSESSYTLYWTSLEDLWKCSSQYR